jgi:hypothetical protein
MITAIEQTTLRNLSSAVLLVFSQPCDAMLGLSWHEPPSPPAALKAWRSG